MYVYVAMCIPCKRILGLELRIPDCILTLAAALMDFLDPVGRFADAAAAPVERCNAHVACLSLPLAICASLASTISSKIPQIWHQTLDAGKL
jgi:hypothetical protein